VTPEHTDIHGCGVGVVAFAIILLSLPLPAEAPRQIATAWLNGQWFNGVSFAKLDIYSVGPRLTLRRPSRVDRTVDLTGKFVTAAFGEAHNHNIPSQDTAATIRSYLSQGIYYVMIQENQPQARELQKDLIDNPKSIDVAFANGAFTAPGGHPSALVERNIRAGGMTAEDRDGGFLHPVSSIADIDKRWAEVKRQRPDFIKMMLVYSEERVDARPPLGGSDRYGLDSNGLPRHIVALAHREKLRVSAHVESAADFETAVEAGVDIVAHLPGFWPDSTRIASKGVGIYRIADEVARRAGRQHVAVVTTLGEALQFLGNNPEAAGYRGAMLDVYRHNLAVLAKYGVRIAIGSDQFRGTSIPEALEIRKAQLMTPAALLKALSTDAATVIFPERGPFGPAEGAQADFLVLDANPLIDFSAITKIHQRVKGGEDL
jgi:hypothetical protein